MAALPLSANQLPGALVICALPTPAAFSGAVLAAIAAAQSGKGLAADLAELWGRLAVTSGMLPRVVGEFARHQRGEP